MSVQGVSRRYAEALLSLALEKNRQGEYAEELDLIVDTIQANNGLSKVFYGFQFASRDKITALRRIFQDHVSEDVLHFLLLLVEKHRYSYLEEIRDAYAILLDQERGIVEAVVSSPYPLSDDELAKLEANLARLQDVGEIRIKQEIDSDLLAGIRLQIGDIIMDGSAKTRLENIRKQLVHDRKQEVNR